MIVIDCNKEQPANWEESGGISGTWVNALTVRVMNTGCDRHLIALVSVKISTMDL